MYMSFHRNVEIKSNLLTNIEGKLNTIISNVMHSNALIIYVFIILKLQFKYINF